MREGREREKKGERENKEEGRKNKGSAVIKRKILSDLAIHVNTLKTNNPLLPNTPELIMNEKGSTKSWGEMGAKRKNHNTLRGSNKIKTKERKTMVPLSDNLTI